MAWAIETVPGTSDPPGDLRLGICISELFATVSRGLGNCDNTKTCSSTIIVGGRYPRGYRTQERGISDALDRYTNDT